MALREIVVWPAPILKDTAKPVIVFDDELRALLADMVDTMYAADGVGLAAPQVGVGLRVFVVDADREGSEAAPKFFINPEIVQSEGETLFEEGCLSVPGELIEIPRFTNITMRAQDPNGEYFELEADGLEAIALQHELDHLNGVLIVDRLSTIKRGLVKKRMVALKEEQEE